MNDNFIKKNIIVVIMIVIISFENSSMIFTKH